MELARISGGHAVPCSGCPACSVEMAKVLSMPSDEWSQWLTGSGRAATRRDFRTIPRRVVTMANMNERPASSDELRARMLATIRGAQAQQQPTTEGRGAVGSGLKAYWDNVRARLAATRG